VECKKSDVNLQGDNIETTQENTETSTDASKEDGLEVNAAEKIKYMLLSCHLNGDQNHDIKRANRLFENVAQFIYLGMTATIKDLIQEEIKRRLTIRSRTISVLVCYLKTYNNFAYDST
jgi:hypothetical protein